VIMFTHLTMLTNSKLAPVLMTLVKQWGNGIAAKAVTDLDELAGSLTRAPGRTLLVSFGTGVIVPREMIDALSGACLNIHPGSPDYPGRDPHHFAAYDSAPRYGATAHVMTERVDAGAILDVELFDVPSGATPQLLLEQAEAAGCRIFDRLVQRCLRGDWPTPQPIAWGQRKTTRADFLALSEVSPLESPVEFDRRQRATALEPYRNLWTQVNGYRFTIASRMGDAPKRSDLRWAEFTEDGYVRLLGLAAGRYRFATYREPGSGPHVLWRHDIDYSVHRALRLAQLEQERGVVATYFFCLRLPFYNMFEPAVQRKAREIVSLGHRVGLHFDATAYPDELWTVQRLEQRMRWERTCMEELLDTEVDAVSFHDPNAGGMMRFDDAELAGMVNAYSSQLRQGYGYCSDSNGYWRHRPIGEVIRSGEYEKLQVLTHPGWWTPAAGSPWMRIERAVMGRARAVMRGYDQHLDASGRQNIR